MELSDFDYTLPEAAIAQEPAAERDRARLLVHERASARTTHHVFRELPELLAPGDLLVVNDTRVLRARLFAHRASGGRVEVFLLEPVAGEEWLWRVQMRPARRLREGERLALEGLPASVALVAREHTEDGAPAMEWRARVESGSGEPLDPRAVMERVGHVPLPPYVQRADAEQDAERYQTVYAREPGAVAAPTAGLHFTPELLERLEAAGIGRAAVTLHVGPGTFQPVKSARVEDHRMHAERFELSGETVATIERTRAAGRRIVAVGTTVVRVLESCAREDGTLAARQGTTSLFLVPGARFRVIDALVTNFHLPRSTLLMLVAAFAGRERVLALYREALEAGYRFYSYGDAMLLL